MKLTRRTFLKSAVTVSGAGFARADELPANTNPRAIFSNALEPDRNQRLTVSVGPKK